MSKRQKLGPLDPFSPVPQQGPFTNVPHPELYAVEPSMGRCVAVLETTHRHRDAVDTGEYFVPEPTLNPRPRPQVMVSPPGDVEPDPSIGDAEEAADMPSDVSTQAPIAYTEDIGTVQFSSICSPFLATSDVPMQAGRPHPPDPPSSLSLASSTPRPDCPLDGVDPPETGSDLSA